MRRSLGLPLVVLAVFVGLGANAEAAPQSVSACAGDKGALRLAKKCRKGERTVRLLVAPGDSGPQGARGPKGDPGEQGPPGQRGSANAGSCPANNAVSGVLQSGDLNCSPFPTYSAGNGLGLAGSTFSLAPPFALTANSAGPIVQHTNTGSGPAAAFTSTSAPFLVSSSAKVGNLNADRLDGLSANEFVRTAVAAVNSYNNGGTFVPQATININAPRNGLILVSGSVSMSTLAGGNTSCNPCLGVMRLRDDVSGATGTEQAGTFGNGSDESSAQLATSWVFAVTAGTRTFKLDTLTTGAASDVYSDNATLTALFVPFGSGG